MNGDTAAPVIALSLLVFTGFFYGAKFFRAGNVLLGLEWCILAFSASNGVLFFLAGFQPSYPIMMFCDAFSRTVGVPVIATIGIMQVTHNLRPSALVDTLLFAVGGVAALVILNVPAAGALLPIGSIVLGLIYQWILVVMIVKLWRLNRRGLAVALVITLIAFLFISFADGIFEIPNPNHSPLLDFWVLSCTTWAIGFAVIYYAYRAIEKGNAAGAPADTLPADGRSRGALS